LNRYSSSDTLLTSRAGVVRLGAEVERNVMTDRFALAQLAARTSGER